MLTPLCACCLFIFFLSFSFSSKLVNGLGATTFGIYLIHESILSSFIWNGVFKVSEIWLSSYFPLLAMLDVAMLFVACSLMDYIRIRFFEMLMLKNINKIEIKMKRKFLKKGNEIG